MRRAAVSSCSAELTSQLHQFLGPLLSILLTVPLGPHPVTGPGPSPFDLRSRASDVLAKLVSQYAATYPGLIPRLLSTLTKALQAPPFPSPLGADHPPAGRYEGAVLGISALGPQSVRSTLWGARGEGLAVIDGLVVSLYPGDGRKSKTGLMKATFRALGSIIDKKPEAGVPPPPAGSMLEETFGPNIAKALEKRPWMACEMVRLWREAGDADAEDDEDDDEDEDMEDVEA